MSLLQPSLPENQKKVLKYLLDVKVWVSPTTIGQEVGGWPRDSSWAIPICKRLVKKELAEQNAQGDYRAVPVTS